MDPGVCLENEVKQWLVYYDAVLLRQREEFKLILVDLDNLKARFQNCKRSSGISDEAVARRLPDTAGGPSVAGDSKEAGVILNLYNNPGTPAPASYPIHPSIPGNPNLMGNGGAPVQSWVQK